MPGFISIIPSKIRLVPAALAIVVQCAALVAVLVFALIFGLFTAVYFDANSSFSILLLVLMQALTAAIFSYWVGMDRWWHWIHLCFPLAIWSMLHFPISNEIYLAGFVVSLSLFWTTFRTQVPFFPSRPIVWQQVAELMPQDKPVRMIDIGSGLGDVVMHIAKLRPESHIEGIEIAPLPWLVSFIRARFRHSSAIFKLGDYRELDFSGYDVVFAYLSPAAMSALWEKARHEMRAGSILVSYEFEISGVIPSSHVAGDKQSPAIYVWKLP